MPSLLCDHVDQGLLSQVWYQPTVQTTSVLTKASVRYEIGLLWANITHVKGHAMALGFCLKQIWIRSSKWGTVRPCRFRGCKNIRGQSWRSIRNCQLSQIRDWCARGPADLADFFDLQLWPLIFLQPLDLQGCTVPRLKDLINICLENESQGLAMTFRMIYPCPKSP